MWDIRGIPPVGPFFTPPALPAGGPVPSTPDHFTLIPRVPDPRHTRRSARASEIIASIINSLSRRGYLTQAPDGEYDLDVETILPVQPNLTAGTYQLTGAVFTIDDTGIITNIVPSPAPIPSVNYVKPIYVETPDAANSGNTETDLWSKTISASGTTALTTDGQSIVLEAMGEWGINGGSVDTVRVYVGAGSGTLIHTISASPTTKVDFRVQVRFQRKDSTTLFYHSMAIYNTGAASPLWRSSYNTSAVYSLSVTMASDFNVRITGQTDTSNTGDIVLRQASLYWYAATQ